MRPAHSEIRSLTGLRGIAAVGVALYHFTSHMTTLGLQPKFHVPGGYLAVDLFFLISGFVLSYNYVEKFSSIVTMSSYFGFYAQRIARIYPAFLFFCLLYLLKMTVNVSGDMPIEKFKLYDYAGNIFMLNGLGLNVVPLIPPSWSVSAEMFCYFLFPFIIFMINKKKASQLVLAATAMASLLLAVHFGHGAKGSLDVVSQGSQWSLLRALAGFTLGTLIYPLWARHYEMMTKYADIGLVIAVTGFLVTTAYGLDDIFKYPFLALCVQNLASGTKIGYIILENRIVYYLGEISYSIYLGHALIMGVTLRFIEKMLSKGLSVNWWVELACYIALIIMLSAISYPIFEVRAKRALSRALVPLAEHL